jgi:hypothetical protein
VRALLDENMPKALARLLAPEIEARTVRQEGWSGRSNGDLLTAASASFDVFITTDRGIPHQQNLSRYAIGIVLLEARSNRIEDLAPLVPEVKARVASVAPGVVIRVTA